MKKIPQDNYTSREYAQLIDANGDIVGQILPNQPIVFPGCAFKPMAFVRLIGEKGEMAIDGQDFYEVDKPETKRKTRKPRVKKDEES